MTLHKFSNNTSFRDVTVYINGSPEYVAIYSYNMEYCYISHLYYTFNILDENLEGGEF